MSKWADAFNALPPGIRHIGAMNEAELRIQHLKFEKDRLKKRHRQSFKEINDHIANVESFLAKEGVIHGGIAQCTWEPDDNDTWKTQCEHLFEFYTDGPLVNGFRFCPYCGRVLVETTI